MGPSHANAAQVRPCDTIGRVQATAVRALAFALALVGTLIPPLPADAAGGQVFTFEGGGWGHSVGKSQYGAFGMSKEGYSYQQIVEHFYTDSSVVNLSPALANEPLWVNVATSTSLGTVSLRVVSIASGQLPVTVSSDSESFTAVVGDTIVIEAIGNHNCTVSGPGGTITGPCDMDIEWDGNEDSPTRALQIVGCSTCTYARGELHVRPHTGKGKFNLSLEIEVEDYVLGIREMPYSWGLPEYGGMAALESQAVTARSYAVRTALDRGDPSNRTDCWCQLSVTTADQVYVGYGFGWQVWIDAVHNTAGKVVTHPGQSNNKPVKTFYSSSTYGFTENYEDGFGGSTAVPYLRAVDDHWSANPDLNPNARWERDFTGQELAAALEGRPGIPSLGVVTGVSISECSVSGAALEITFQGTGGSAAVSTRLLRTYLGLKSMQVYNVGSPPGSPPCPGAVGSTGGVPSCNGIAYQAGNPAHVLYPGGFPSNADGTVIVNLQQASAPRVVFWDGFYEGSVRIDGTSFGDTICGGDNTGGHSDWIHGRGGSDLIFGRGAADILSGGSGSDTIYGEDGADTLRGGQGDDHLDGGNGDDSLLGGSENDTIFGGAGSDDLFGGAGEDALHAVAGDGNLLLGGAGRDHLEAGPGNGDVLRARGGHDTLVGGSGDATRMYGNKGNDTINGGSGAGHQLFGGPGDDMLFGGPGPDHVLDGGTGTDTLTPA